MSTESTQPNGEPSDEAIAVRAYLLWEQAGSPEGFHEHFWLQAKQELAAGTSYGGAGDVKAAWEKLPNTFKHP